MVLFLSKSLLCRGCQCSSYVLFVQSLITPLETFSDIPIAGSGAVSGCEGPCLANSSAISFPLIPMCPCTLTSWIVLCSSSFTRVWWLSQTKLEFIWKLSRALRLPDCQKECRCSYLCSPLLYSPLYKP